VLGPPKIFARGEPPAYSVNPPSPSLFARGAVDPPLLPSKREPERERIQAEERARVQRFRPRRT
jgi:hypothetical protein